MPLMHSREITGDANRFLDTWLVLAEFVVRSVERPLLPILPPKLDSQHPTTFQPLASPDLVHRSGRTQLEYAS